MGSKISAILALCLGFAIVDVSGIIYITYTTNTGGECVSVHCEKSTLNTADEVCVRRWYDTDTKDYQTKTSYLKGSGPDYDVVDEDGNATGDKQKIEKNGDYYRFTLTRKNGEIDRRCGDEKKDFEDKDKELLKYCKDGFQGDESKIHEIRYDKDCKF